MSVKTRDYDRNMCVTTDEMAHYQWCIDMGLFEPHRNLAFANVAVLLLQEEANRMWSRAEMAEFELNCEKERADKAEAELRAIRRILNGAPSSDDQQCGRR